MPSHTLEERLRRHAPPGTPATTAEGGAPTSEDTILRELLSRLAQPALTLPPMDEQGNLGKFISSVAGATNPDFATRFIAPELEQRRMRPEREAEFAFGQEQKKTGAIQNLLSFLSLAQDREARQEQARVNAANKAQAERDRLVVMRQRNATAKLRYEALTRQGESYQLLRSADQRINLLIKQRDNAHKTLTQLLKQAQASNIMQLVEPEDEPALIEASAAVEELDRQIAEAYAGLGQPAAPGQATPPPTAPPGPGGGTLLERLRSLRQP